MSTLSSEMHAWAVRAEMSRLALAVHKLTNESGADLTDALTALADIEQMVASTRKALLELPKEEQ